MGDLVYNHLAADVSELGARNVWVREEARDVKQLAFFAARGLSEMKRATLEDGMEIVALKQELR